MPRLLLIVLCMLSGCATVRPWERDYLAKPSMHPPFGDDVFASAYDAKLIETTTAGGLPGDAPGGGCGCTQ